MGESMVRESESLSLAERRAEAAENLPAFSGTKLLHIRRQIGKILGLIGRDGLFDQYTAHDLTHIDKMLTSLNWLIPETTQNLMSPTDWLMTVLAIYFHDLGMLVTKDEYANREQSGYLQFRDDVLQVGDAGRDYATRVVRLGPEDSDRFFYQEFVRHHHAERIGLWINGQTPPYLGSATAAADQVAGLLEPLGPQFRRDLALVCESHHLDDLNDFSKYKVSQPYGDSDDETANVQYAALLVRTADLLHITADRTPSVLFRLISPSDPVSQEAWAKHMAVKRVRAKPAVDAEGTVDPGAQSDTIEVHAYFTDAEGFFGLTTYLGYAAQQVRQSHEWAQAANRLYGVPHHFPWRAIDDTHIETQGFLRQTFQFELDQPKILDLLTGHTLYNDSRIVLRELIQNAVDAVRLQQFESGTSAGRVLIQWNSRLRELVVEDNGTGMTQSIIEQHLLRVGSSRYQDAQFVKEHPTFSAISRFGIGVLSTFMVADEVEVTTCHPDEIEARHLTLRSLHGRYLVRLLPKHLPEVAGIAPHGTRIRLRLRPSAEIGDVLRTARTWVVIPGCEVLVQVDESPMTRVGFDSPKAALEATISAIAGRIPENVRVIETTLRGVTVAVAVQLSEYFREWSFLLVPRYQDRDEVAELELGTCVEGIRVEFNSPGFQSKPIFAIANATGSDAPKTNVARSGLEVTPQLLELLRAVYQAYVDHIVREMNELHRERSFSLTWASEAATYLLGPVGDDRAALSSPRVFTEVIEKAPLVLVEDRGARMAVAPSDLKARSVFWTVDAAVFRSAEALLREVPSNASLTELIRTLKSASTGLPDGPVVCHVEHDDFVSHVVFGGREIAEIRIYRDERRVDLAWSIPEGRRRWTRLNAAEDPRRVRRFGVRERPDLIWVGCEAIATRGLDGDLGVRSSGTVYLVHGTPLASFLCDTIYKLAQAQWADEVRDVLATLVSAFIRTGAHGRKPEEMLEFAIRAAEERSALSVRQLRREVEAAFPVSELYDALAGLNWRVFDASAWRRETSSWGE